MFRGSMVALITPMAVDGGIDEQVLKRLVQWHLEQGTDALVPVGTTGESPTLDMAEHCQVIRWVVDECNGQIPVIAGAGANATREAIELARCAMHGGADACLTVTPYYNKPTQEGLYQHFAAVADAVPLPHILYNVPGRTGVDLLPDTVVRLAEISNIVGLKEATGSVERAEEIVDRCGERLDVFSGNDDTGLALMQVGARGIISVTANLAPAKMHRMCSAALDGNWDEADRLNTELDDLHRALFSESNPIPVKWAMHELGLAPPGIRLPLTPLSEPYHETVRAAMRSAGILHG